MYFNFQMEDHVEKGQSDPMDGRITTFAPPTVLAAILDDNSVARDVKVAQNTLDTSKTGRRAAVLIDSLDASLHDSLESAQLQGISELRGLDQVESKEDLSLFTNNSKLVVSVTKELPDFPKSSTPVQKVVETKETSAEKTLKSRPSQHIIERNKRKVSKRSSTKSSYAQIHAIKLRNKDNMGQRAKMQENQTEEISFGSDVGMYLGNEGHGHNSDLNQFSYPSYIRPFHNNSNSEEHSGLEEHDIGFADDSFLNRSLISNQKGESYYSTSVNYSTHLTGHTSEPVSHEREYQSAKSHFRQSHGIVDPVGSLHHNFSTQSAPPGMYGYQREPLITSLHHVNEEFYLSSFLQNSDFVDSVHTEKFPESSLQKRFSSEPRLENLNFSSSQKGTDVQRNSKAASSNSSLQPPYKPYTLQDYKTFTGSKAKLSAGGLGPNINTDDYRERIKKVIKQRDYATMLRAQHSTMKRQRESQGPATLAAKPHPVKEAEMKRQAALNYAKNVPKPKQAVNRKASKSGLHRAEKDDQEITLLEILRLRHEQEKKEVDSIRKDLASKLRL
ncbi:jhy protein homolog [Montipora capricornis]|uniref:jhy protein homolog n=1 Tax=Montipora capricornis TaxID=246305 RepID=UPI0035F1BD0B